jgi:hypothetical protein
MPAPIGRRRGWVVDSESFLDQATASLGRIHPYRDAVHAVVFDQVGTVALFQIATIKAA